MGLVALGDLGHVAGGRGGGVGAAVVVVAVGLAVGHVGGGEAGVQVGDLEVHGALAKEVAALLLPVKEYRL